MVRAYGINDPAGYGYGYGFKLGLHRSPTSLPLVQLRRRASGGGQFSLGGGTVFPRYMYPGCIVPCIQPQHTAIHA